MKVPHHVAIIMDGNGRWAKQHNKPRSEGHIAGADNLRTVLTAAANMGIKVLTVYAFSTENWGRPSDEVDALMRLLAQYLISEDEQMQKDGVQLCTIGDLSRLPEDVQEYLRQIKERTKNNHRISLVLALNYSSRSELVRVANLLADKVLSGKLKSGEITETDINAELYTSVFPEPDLLIRTGGEQRISNFLLWQISYAELYFTDTYWPDFNADELQKAIAEYNNRERRFGKTSEQIAEEQV